MAHLREITVVRRMNNTTGGSFFVQINLSDVISSREYVGVCVCVPSEQLIKLHIS